MLFSVEEFVYSSDVRRDSSGNLSNEYLLGDNDSSNSHTPGSADGTSSTGSYRQSGSMGGSSEDVTAVSLLLCKLKWIENSASLLMTALKIVLLIFSCFVLSDWARAYIVHVYSLVSQL